MKESKIEWADHTFNYAKTTSQQLMNESYWAQPLKWNRDAAEAGTRARVFFGSMMDVLEDHPQLIEARARLLLLIHVTPYLDWLLLTKRPEGWSDRLHEVVQLTHDGADMVASQWLDGDAPANVWLGTSVEDQRRADERIPELLKIPAAVRFLSCAPLLGTVHIPGYAFYPTQMCDCPRSNYKNGGTPTFEPDSRFSCCPQCGHPYRVMTGIRWVICGGESGLGARPMHPDWARSLRDQCQAAGVPFFFSGWGAWVPMSDYDPELHGADCNRHQHAWLWRGEPGNQDELPMSAFNVGKHAAGRLLDGRTWDEFPQSVEEEQTYG